jgi:4-amino-4-deoxy-L-arabinose transferase-like glycosyltransferase
MGPRAGLCAAFLAAIHPYLIKYSADVLKDTMLLCFAATAFALALKGHRQKRYLLVFLAGLAAWTTSLVRVYGVVVVVSISAAIIVTGLVDRRKWHETARELALFALPLPAIGYPLHALYVGAGGEYITQTVATLIRVISRQFPLVESYRETLIANNPGVNPYYLDVITSYPWLSAFREFLDVLVTGASVSVSVLFLAGVWLGRSTLIRRGPTVFVLACAAVVAFADVFIVTNLFFLSKRHVLVLVILLLPWSALALDRVIGGGLDGAQKRYRVKPAVSGTVLSALFVAALALTLAFTSFLDPEIEKRYYKRAAGEYIRELGRPNPALAIVPSDRLTVFYAGGIEILYEDPGALEETIRRQKPDFVLWDTDAGPLPEQIRSLAADGVIEEIGTIHGAGEDSIVIYRTAPGR